MAKRPPKKASYVDVGHRWSLDEIDDVTQTVRRGMARTLWEDVLVTYRENILQDGGDVDIGEARGGVPDAALHAIDDLTKLYGFANGIGDHRAPDRESHTADDDQSGVLMVADDAAEIGALFLARKTLMGLNAPLFVLAHRASEALGLTWSTMMSDYDLGALGYYLYMEAVGHGVIWEDNYPKFDRDGATLKRRVRFDADLHGGSVSWSGSAGELRVSGSEDSGWTFDDDDDADAVTNVTINSEPADQGLPDPDADAEDGRVFIVTMDIVDNQQRSVTGEVRLFWRRRAFGGNVTRMVYMPDPGADIEAWCSAPLREAVASLGGPPEQQAALFDAIEQSASTGDEVGLTVPRVQAAPRIPPRIRTAFRTVTPGESDEDEPEEETGWDDEVGVEIDPDDDGGYIAPAVEFLLNAGATEPSSGSWQAPPVTIWYSTVDDEIDYQTGERTSRDYFLDNFTPAELREIFDRMTTR